MTIVIANTIDLVAALIQICSGTLKKKSKILIVQIVQLFLQGVSMLLLGGVTGAINNAMSCYRNYLCYKEKLNHFWKAAIIVISAGLTFFFNQQGVLGVLPVVICAVYIIFMDIKDPVKFKILVTLSFLPWMVYHFMIRSYVGAIFDAASVITNAITLYLMVADQKSKKDSK